MSDKLSIYKCGVCGNMVELIAVGEGQLVCCDQPMKHFVENTVDAAQEKHVPVVEKVDGGYKVTVGSVAHPMLQEHYIEWIELVTETRTYRKFLKPGEAPEAVFKTDCKNVYAREYCNLHGLWRS